MSKEYGKTLFTLVGGSKSTSGDMSEDALTLSPFLLDLEDKEAPTPSIGVERYQKRSLLGQGGMGAVHEAYDTVLHRPVATKSLHEEVPTSSPLWKRFYREAQITAQLAHPSIVPVYSIEFTDEQQPLMIMKRILGITLEDYIEDCK